MLVPPPAVVLPEVLTLKEATAVLAKLLDAQKSSGGSVCADARALRKFDSSALAVLLECRRAALEQGRNFRVEGLPSALQGLAGVYGVADLLGAEAVGH